MPNNLCLRRPDGRHALLPATPGVGRRSSVPGSPRSSLEIGCMQSSAREDDCCGCAGSCDGGSRTLRQDVCDCDDQRCNIPADVLEAAGLLADASRGAAVLDTYTRLTAERCVGTYLSVHAGCAAAANAPPPCCCHCCNSLIFAR